MRRPTLNLLIDSVAFAGFVFLTTTGVLMRYVLPPGSGHRTVVWGLDRHEWGAVHFWIAAGFLGVLAFHLFLHWKWILNAVRGRPREGSGARVGLGLVGLLAVLALAAAPLVSSVERIDGGAGQQRESFDQGDPASVRGSMTLREVERSTGVPAAYILKELGLAADASLDEPLGRLGRVHGFQIDDVRWVVRQYEEGG